MYPITFLVLLVASAVLVSAGPHHNAGGVDHAVLKFKVSGRDLKDKHKLSIISLDPYVVITYTDGSGHETKLGRSETLSNTRDPDWQDTFSFEFDREKDQKWHFEVLDDDRLNEKSTEGDAWVKVSDYVDSDQNLQVNLSKKGYIIIKQAS